MDRGGWVGFTPYCVHRKPAAARRGRVCSRTLGVTTTPSPTDDARGEASGERRGWCAMLRPQDAQPNAWQGRLRQQWRQIPAKGCRVGRREGAAMMPPLGRRPASVRSTRPSLQLELQHHLRHRTSSWQTVLVSVAAQPDSHPVMQPCMRLRWQVRRDEPEKPSLPRQPDPSLERWFLPLIHFLRQDCASSHAPRRLHRFCRCPRRCPSRHRLSRRRVLHHLAHHLAHNTWPVIGGSALCVTTSLLSSKHGLPERNSNFSSAARGWQHVAP